MNIPCDRRITCPGDDSPIRNYSAEGPDRRLFCSTGYFQDIPKLGECWEKTGCAQIACSLDSKEQANLDAYNAASQCVWSTWSTPSCDPAPPGIPPTVPPPQEPPRTPITLYTNTKQSCTVYCGDGMPFTYTVAAGRYIMESQAEANAAAYSEACTKAQQHLLCISYPATPWCKGTVYNSTITATTAFSTAGAAWQLVSGSLPPGLTFTSFSTFARIAGTPTATGTYTFYIKVTLSNGDTMTKLCSITICQITTTSLPDASTTAYAASMAQAGATSPAWAVIAGSLPPGITMSVTGVFGGTATTAGDYAFTVALYEGGSLACTISLTITVSECPPGGSAPDIGVSYINNVSLLFQGASQEISIVCGDPGFYQYIYYFEVCTTNALVDVLYAGTTSVLPYTFSLSGNVPSGLSIDPNSGHITVNHTDTSDIGNVYQVTVNCTNACGSSSFPINFYIAPTVYCGEWHGSLPSSFTANDITNGLFDDITGSTGPRIYPGVDPIYGAYTVPYGVSFYVNASGAGCNTEYILRFAQDLVSDVRLVFAIPRGFMTGNSNVNLYTIFNSWGLDFTLHTSGLVITVNGLPITYDVWVTSSTKNPFGLIFAFGQ